MRSVFRASFVENGNALVTVVRGRIEKHLLDRARKGNLKATKLWSAKVKHCSSVVEAPAQDLVIATDTMGRHFGLCLQTGVQRWQSDPVGEGDPGVITARSTFLFATWAGTIQELDPADGRQVSKPVQYASQLRSLHATKDKKHLSLVCLIPALSDDDPTGEALCHFDVNSRKLREKFRNTHTQGMRVSPDGSRVLSCYWEDYTGGARVPAWLKRVQHWVISDVASGKILCGKTFGPTERFYPNVIWSPDSNMLGAVSHFGHQFLSTDTLSTISFLRGEFPSTLAFHPAGTDVCLCRSKNTRILQVSELERLSADVPAYS